MAILSARAKYWILFSAYLIMFTEIVIPLILGLVGFDFVLFSWIGLSVSQRDVLMSIAIVIAVWHNWAFLRGGFKKLSGGIV